ncbi:MAG: hypothetical protein M0Z55_05110 [Peptococcaceae bacterium]|nr:hypothetical protein [Peptococcaceae bacterium]
MECHKCENEVEESGHCPTCDSGMLNEIDEAHNVLDHRSEE